MSPFPSALRTAAETKTPRKSEARPIQHFDDLRPKKAIVEVPGASMMHDIVKVVKLHRRTGKEIIIESLSDLPMYGRLPADWYINESEALRRYDGEYLLAVALEAYPYTPTFHHVAAILSGFPTFHEAFGLLPDLQAARYLAKITRDDVAEILGVSVGLVEAWEAGVVPFSGRTASLLCRSLDWPFAALVRGIGTWHPRTKTELEGRGDLL